MGHFRPLFVYFRSFHMTNRYSTNLTMYDKSVDGVLGTRTRDAGGRSKRIH